MLPAGVIGLGTPVELEQEGLGKAVYAEGSV